MIAMHRLNYTGEATDFTEALPLGNGRLGAMAYGGAQTDKFSLNEDSFWSGYPNPDKPENAPAALERARALIDEGKLAAAQREIEQNFTGHFTESYLPLGYLTLKRDALPATEAYSRFLDLHEGVHVSKFTSAGITYATEAFASHPAQAIVIRLTASAPGALNFVAALNCDIRHEISAADNRITMRVEAPGRVMPSYLGLPDPIKYYEERERRGMRAAVMCEIACEDGDISVSDNGKSLRVKNANAATLIICARTSFAGFDKQPFVNGLDEIALCEGDINSVRGADYAELKRAHIADFSQIMERADFHIDGESEDLPTNELLEKNSGLRADPKLCELLFTYGRYLTASASRPGTRAMNLQGIWNESPVPPWSSNYTININTQMNYFPAETANLSDMHSPLFDLIDELIISGRQTAHDFYGVSGAAAHHNADIWARTNPMGEQREGCAVWSHWPMSLGWLCRHYFDHYLYTLDRDFLKNRALPAMRAAAEFYLDVMRADERGRLRVYPATSPENNFIYEGETLAVTKSATMSNAIVRELITNYLSALEILGIDEPLKPRALKALPKIWGFDIGSKGQLLEWDGEFEEAEPNHRHTSHLYALHPGTQISPVKTPELAKACEKTLELRGDDGTGWSLGWKICFWARLRNGDHALKLLTNQLRLVRNSKTTYSRGGGTYPNMFDAHPPFQIDGNFGACAGICEMLLQSAPGEITLLPALPGEWQTGGFKNLRAMGDIEVSARFGYGKLNWALIAAYKQEALPVTIFCDGKQIAEITKTGEHEIYVRG